MLFEVDHSRVSACVPVLHADDASDAAVVNELGTHEARFARDNDPRACRRAAVRDRVGKRVHLCMMAPMLKTSARWDLQEIPLTDLSSAETRASTGSPVVTVTDDGVPRGVEHDGAELAPRAVRHPGDCQAMLYASTQVLLIHR